VVAVVTDRKITNCASKSYEKVFLIRLVQMSARKCELSVEQIKW
jgi:hypothetical protein